MPYPRYVSEPMMYKPYVPSDLICRWCLYYQHSEIGVYWVNFRCKLDDSPVDMWGTCDAWAPWDHASEISAHEKAAVLATKGTSYHMTR